MSLELAALISSISTASGIAKTLVGLHDATQLNTKVIEFQNAMIQANIHVMAIQQEDSTLTERVQELEKENARLKDWSAEKQNYALREVAAGVFAQTEKDFVGNLESAKKLCCNCFEEGTKSPLQQSSEPSRRIGLNCFRCAAKMVFDCYIGEVRPDAPGYVAGPGDKVPW